MRETGGGFMKKFLSAILFVGVSQAAFAGIYDLTFRRVAHSSDPETCRTFTEKVVYELTQQSSAQVISSGCRADEYTTKGLDSVITYQATAPLAMTSTGTLSVYSSAFYSDLGKCNERLDLQKKLFTSATGLKPLTAYCALDVGSFTKAWETRVDGIGETKVQPHAAAVSIWGSIIDGKSVLQNYLDAAQGYGITIFEVGMTRSGLGNHLVVRHYSTEPLSLHDYDDMKFENAAACANAASALRTSLQSADKPTVVFCEQDKQGVATLHATAFESLLKPVRVFKAQALATQFATLSLCEQGAKGILDGAHYDIFGALCAGAGKGFRIHLFSRP